MTTQEIRDRILTVLRDAGEPLTTAEASNRAGARREVRPCSDWHHRYDGVGSIRVASCDGTNDVMEVPFNTGQRGWRALAQLEKDGTVRGIRVPGHRAVMWVLAGSRVEEEIDHLEAAFAVPAHQAGGNHG